MARIARGLASGPAAATGPAPRPVVARGPGRPQLRYERTIEMVDALITDRGLRPGDLLPPGHEIARLAGVSLISVRRALDELERAGRVVRHQGVGTFVGEPRIVAEPSRVGDLLATLGGGRDGEDVTTTLLGLDRGLPDPAIRRALDLEEGEVVWHIVRLRRIGGRARVLERSALPVRVVPDVDEAMLRAGGSLYAFLGEHHGLAASHEEQYLHVGTPTADERRLLELHGHQPVVRLRGASVTADGTPFDCFEQVYPASDFVFYISGRSSGELLAASELMSWGVSAIPGGRAVT
jgi:DNA-binding GntR family transcriptional regulator